MKDLEKVKRLLIVVDMVNGFVKEGALADPYIQHIVPKIKKLVDEFTAGKESDVVFIRDAHHPDSLEFTKFPIHCLKGTYESELIDELQGYKEAREYLKNSRSFMFAPHFMSDLDKMRALREIVVTGCCLDLCDLDGALPLINYLDEQDRKVEVIVPTDAVETYDGPGHDREEYRGMALKLMRQEGIKVVDTYQGGRK